MGFRFGMMTELETTTATLSFIVVIFAIVVLESFTEILEITLITSPLYNHMIQKIYKELMLMGIISFAILMYETDEKQAVEHHSWILSIDFAHILLFYSALFFVVHAFYIIASSHLNSKENIRTQEESTGEIIENIEESNTTYFGWILYRIHYLWVSKLRYHVEFKIAHCHFLDGYFLPVEFDFARYVNGCYEKYALNTLDRSMLSWLVMILLCAVNYLRVRFHLVFNCPEHSTDSSSLSHNSSDTHYSSPDHSPTYQPTYHHRSLSSSSSSSSASHSPSPSYECYLNQSHLFYWAGFVLVCYTVTIFFLSRYYHLRLLSRPPIRSSSDYASFLEMAENKRQNEQSEGIVRMTLQELRTDIDTILDESEEAEEARSKSKMIANLLHSLASSVWSLFESSLITIKRAKKSRSTKSRARFDSDDLLGLGAQPNSPPPPSSSSLMNSKVSPAPPSLARAPSTLGDVKQKLMNPGFSTKPSQVSPHPHPSPRDVESGTSSSSSSQGTGDLKGGRRRASLVGSRRADGALSFSVTSFAPVPNSSPTPSVALREASPTSSTSPNSNNGSKTRTSFVHFLQKSFSATMEENKPQAHLSAQNPNPFPSPNNHSLNPKTHDQLSLDLNTIFLFGSPELYYNSVELVLMSNCLYLSLWATTFISIVGDQLKDQNYLLWQIAMLLPVLTALPFIGSITRSCSLIQAVSSLNIPVLQHVLLEAEERNTAISDLSLRLIHASRQLKETQKRRKEEQSQQIQPDEPITAEHVIETIEYLYLRVDEDEGESLDKLELRHLLRLINLHFSDEKFSRLFIALDRKCDGEISLQSLISSLRPSILAHISVPGSRPSSPSLAPSLRKNSEKEEEKDCIGGGGGRGGRGGGGGGGGSTIPQVKEEENEGDESDDDAVSDNPYPSPSPLSFSPTTPQPFFSESQFQPHLAPSQPPPNLIFKFDDVDDQD